MPKVLVTVFTPTYNRAYILEQLYRSLLRQDRFDFEWIVVDDGSTDNTHELVNGWIPEAPFSITFMKKKNGGKHRAINLAVKIARGELFYVIDSDDYLVDNAMKRIAFYWSQVRNLKKCGGIAGLRVFENGEVIGNTFDGEYIDLDCTSFRYKLGIYGDKAELYRTEVMRKYPFPELSNETFIQEAIVANRIALKYYLRWFNEPICVCEYLSDGLSRNMRTVIQKNPKGKWLYCLELLLHPNVTFRFKSEMICSVIGRFFVNPRKWVAHHLGL